MHDYLLQVISISISVTALIHIPIWVLALSQKVLKPFDFVCPFLPIILWLIITTNGIGAQSMTNIFEIPIVVFVTALACILLFFSRFDQLRSTSGRKYILATLLIMVVLLRLLVPVIPQ